MIAKVTVIDIHSTTIPLGHDSASYDEDAGQIKSLLKSHELTNNKVIVNDVKKGELDEINIHWIILQGRTPI